jgi:hypothetical protein
MNNISRRDFLKLGVAGFGALALSRTKFAFADLPEFPTNDQLGRLFATVDIMSKPDTESTVVKSYYQDHVVNIYREVIGANGMFGYRSKIWYETDDGFFYAPLAQPVKNIINTPLAVLPNYGVNAGFWAEVSVPYVELQLDGVKPISPLLIELQEANQPFRFYYSQVLWIDGIKTSDDGTVLYHVTEKYGTYGDKFWADARGFKPLTPEDLSPINPDVSDKSIVVDVDHQSMSCYEGKSEVLYAVVSTGAKYNSEGQAVTDAWATPVGDYYAINRKFTSLHMAGGGNKASGYEDFAVSYTSIFASGGVSFHSTYWHNAWGNPMSHGCVNMKPEEAKFVYRWSQPSVPYEDGKIEQEGYAGTAVRVIEY